MVVTNPLSTQIMVRQLLIFENYAMKFGHRGLKLLPVDSTEGFRSCKKAKAKEFSVKDKTTLEYLHVRTSGDYAQRRVTDCL